MFSKEKEKKTKFGENNQMLKTTYKQISIEKLKRYNRIFWFSMIIYFAQAILGVLLIDISQEKEVNTFFITQILLMVFFLTLEIILGHKKGRLLGLRDLPKGLLRLKLFVSYTPSKESLYRGFEQGNLFIEAYHIIGQPSKILDLPKIKDEYIEIMDNNYTAIVIKTYFISEELDYALHSWKYQKNTLEKLTGEDPFYDDIFEKKKQGSDQIILLIHNDDFEPGFFLKNMVIAPDSYFDYLGTSGKKICGLYTIASMENPYVLFVYQTQRKNIEYQKQLLESISNNANEEENENKKDIDDKKEKKSKIGIQWEQDEDDKTLFYDETHILAKSLISTHYLKNAKKIQVGIFQLSYILKCFRDAWTNNESKYLSSEDIEVCLITGTPKKGHEHEFDPKETEPILRLKIGEEYYHIAPKHEIEEE